MLNTFKRGGVHPDDGKIYAKDKAIETPAVPAQVVIPMSQHFGAPCTPTVKVGDLVKKGQLIGTSDAFLHADIHASTSGKVIKVAPMPHNMMVKCMAVVIEADGKDEWAEGIPKAHDWKQLDSKEILELIKKAGVVGCGGATFPAHVKLAPNKPVDTFIVNGAECEPYLTCDYRAMVEKETTDKLVTGVQICMKVLGVKKAFIGIEDNKPDCIAKFRELVLPEDNIEVLELKTKYPQGAERMLIYAATGRKVNSSMLPADAGCIVDNIDTVTAIYQAVRFGEPLMSRIVTVTGDAVQNPCNFEVPVGILLSELLEQAGGLKNEASKIICGGPMMGKALFTMEVPVTKTTSALTCLTEDEVSALAPSACINCGRCVSVCPGQILPARLSVFAEHGEEEKFLKYGGMECCECGCCSFICPARRPLTQEISSMRKVLLAKRKKK